MGIHISGKLDLDVLGKLGFHQVLELHIPVLLLSESLLQQVYDLDVVLLRQLQLLNVVIENNHVHSKIISLLGCPDDGSNDVVDNIAVSD